MNVQRGRDAMVHGVFAEQPADPHVSRRRDLLEAGRILPPPPADSAEETAGSFLGTVDGFLARLGARGLAAVSLDRPLSDEEFIALGARLGVAQPETDPAVQPYVDREVILNLVSEHATTSDVSLQPFAANALTLHTESSGRPVPEQPRYIVLMCCDPGDDGTAAQTVVVPMTAVAEGLDRRALETLAATRYQGSRDGQSILRSHEGRRVFAFRDFSSQPLEWACEADDRDAEEVNAAIRALLAAMYAPESAFGVHWRRGALVAIDNTFFFHGRTARAAPTANGRRTLKRLRIRQAEQAAAGPSTARA